MATEALTLDQWIARGEKQWTKLGTREKYVTARRWDFAGTLLAIQMLCGDNLKQWTQSYKRIGIDRRRVSEMLAYRRVFATRADAAKVSVHAANILIRRALKEEGKPGPYNPFEDCFATPQSLYDVLNAEFQFALDAAATAESAKCALYITPEEDALTVNWKQRSGGNPIFLNAPFHRDILPEFVRKAYEESQTGLVVVCVLPYYKSYPWYRNYVNEYAEVRQIQGTVVFNGFGEKKGKHAGNVRGPQSFDTVIAIFRPGQKGFSGPYVDRPESTVGESE